MSLNTTHIKDVDHVWNNGIQCGIDSHGTGCMLLGKCVPVLTLDVLQIVEYCFAHVGGFKVDHMLQFLLVYFAKSGYFSAVGRLSFIQI